MKIKMTKLDIAYKAFVYIFCTLFAVICFYPLLCVLAYSVTPYMEYLEHPLRLIPSHFDFSAYEKLLGFDLVYSGYRNTIFITVVGVLLNITLMCLSAYPLSKKDLKGRNFVLGMIPNFYLVRTLGLYDTIWSLIIPGALGAYNLILMKNFMTQIPDSLEESAVIDGANEFVVLFRIIIPLSKPAIATFIIFHAVSQWNGYFNAILYTVKRSLWPLMLVLREMVVEDGMNMVNQGQISDSSLTTIFTMKMAIIIIAVLPIICIYPFLQKYFTKGLMVGSVKG